MDLKTSHGVCLFSERCGDVMKGACQGKKGAKLPGLFVLERTLTIHYDKFSLD